MIPVCSAGHAGADRRPALLERILPDSVAVAEAYDDPPDIPLFSQEALLIRDAVPSRVREFSTARLCARRALARLGWDPVPLVGSLGRPPKWPESTTGSITHCTGYRAAAVARTEDIALLGIDAEPHAPLPEGVLEVIALPAELARVRGALASRPRLRWDRLLFCAKEAVYKAWNPYTEQNLGFEDADIVIDLNAPRFAARLLAPPPAGRGHGIRTLEGTWTVEAGLILTAVALPGPR